MPKIITNELEYSHISLDFMKETYPKEKILEIAVYSKLNYELLLKKEDIIIDGIIDNYPQPMNEYIIGGIPCMMKKLINFQHLLT